MEKTSEMIKRMCPDGVKIVRLGEIGTFENIGVDKKIVEGEHEVVLLNYVDVYHNKYINTSTPTMIVTASDKKRTACNVLKGDIFITPTSETVDDIGHSSVATDDIPNCVYSYHIMRFRQNRLNEITSFYINYIFDLEIVKQQIIKKAQGLTRFGLSKDKFASIEIPLPPLPIQQEIVRILDSFTSMITNLETELASRQKQYEYYRNKLLTFDENDETVEWKTLGEVCMKTSNIKWQKEGSYTEYQYIDLSSVTLDSHNIEGTTTIDKSSAPSRAQQIVKANDVLLGTTRPTLKRYCLVSESYDNQICSTGFCVFRPNPNLVSSKWIYYNLSHQRFWDYCEQYQKGASYPALANSDAFAFEIPFPSFERQQKIVSTLDTFESLIADIKQELDARKKQYEYYREKLLTFE